MDTTRPVARGQRLAGRRLFGHERLFALPAKLHSLVTVDLVRQRARPWLLLHYRHPLDHRPRRGGRRRRMLYVVRS